MNRIASVVLFIAALGGCASPKTRDLTVTRVFETPVEQVWRAWSDAEAIKRWWGPQGFTVPVVQLDFREGGKSLVCMRAPEEYGGRDMCSTWTYQQIAPNRTIDFIFNFADASGGKLEPQQAGVPQGVPSDVRHLIQLKALGACRTEMTMTEYGYTTDEAYEASKSGLDQTLDKLAAALPPC
jgi:uncharacterized protein YndB with AHSA1/START domain